MPSELEKAKARKEALLQQAFVAHNSGVQEDKRLRLMARREMQGLIREQRAAHARWQKEQQRAADEGGWLTGMLMGAGTGMSLGTAIGGAGVGTAVGGVAGAIGGAIYGATEGRQAVAEVAPYAGAISQLASGFSQMEANKKQNQQLIDFYTREGQQAGTPSGEFRGLPRLQGSTLFGTETKGQYPTSVEGGLSLGVPGDFQYRERPLDETMGFDFDTSGESFIAEEAQTGFLDQQIQTGDFASPHQYGPKEFSWLSTEVHPKARYPWGTTGLPADYTGQRQKYLRPLPAGRR